MTRHRFWLGLIFLAVFAGGCSHEAAPVPARSNAPSIRVLFLADVDRVDLIADHPLIAIDSLPSRPTNLPRGIGVQVLRGNDGWHVGRMVFSGGALTILPSTAEGMCIDGVAYRGAFRLLATSAGKFDVINEVAVDDYLKGVVTKEMYANWPLEAIKAQAVASRTYALYEAHSAGVGRAWDVYGDERSQVYGGIEGESTRSRQAVDATAGVVLTYGVGDGHIFRAYFSSCCGGVTQAAADAFPGDPYIPPLREQSRGALCIGSKYFNWGPITITKSELSRRVHLWAERHSAELGRSLPELNITGISQIELQGVNRYGRPNRVLITDVRGVQYSWPAEQLRSAVDTDAQPGTTLPSSYCKINGAAASDAVTFYDGHGFGHGVGMCQWCAEAQAAQGASYIQILATAYPGAKLVPAY